MSYGTCGNTGGPPPAVLCFIVACMAALAFFVSTAQASRRFVEDRTINLKLGSPRNCLDCHTTMSGGRRHLKRLDEVPQQVRDSRYFESLIRYFERRGRWRLERRRPQEDGSGRPNAATGISIADVAAERTSTPEETLEEGEVEYVPPSVEGPLFEDERHEPGRTGERTVDSAPAAGGETDLERHGYEERDARLQGTVEDRRKAEELVRELDELVHAVFVSAPQEEIVEECTSGRFLRKKTYRMKRETVERFRRLLNRLYLYSGDIEEECSTDCAVLMDRMYNRALAQDYLIDGSDEKVSRRRIRRELGALLIEWERILADMKDVLDRKAGE